VAGTIRGVAMNPYDVLGVDRCANRAQIRAAFRRFARRHHPDAGGDVRQFLRGVDAYRRLSAPAGTVRFYRRPRGFAVLLDWRTRRNRPSRVI
jgi:curved DNA-binding protein CbpA